MIFILFLFMFINWMPCIHAVQVNQVTLEEAFTYRGEKIVYIGIGSASHAITWQALPQFMENFLLKPEFAPQCKCINIDNRWKDSFQGSELQKLIEQKFSAVQNHFFMVGDIIRPKDMDQFIAYVMQVATAGGVVFLATFTGPNWIPFVMIEYNKLKKQFPDQITLLSYPTLAWWNGNQYSFYDDIVCNGYSGQRAAYDTLSSKLQDYTSRVSWPEFYKDPLRAIVDWYQDYFKKVSLPKIRETFNIFKNINEEHPEYLKLFLEPFANLSDKSMLDDFLYKQLACMPVKETIGFAITRAQGHDTIQGPQFSPLNLFDFSQFESKFGKAIIEQIKTKSGKLSIASSLQQLNNDFWALTTQLS